MLLKIGRICFTFLQCAFLNVSSNRLPERMQSRIGCICSTFLRCEFSCVLFFNVFPQLFSKNVQLMPAFYFFLFSFFPAFFRLLLNCQTLRVKVSLFSSNYFNCLTSILFRNSYKFDSVWNNCLGTAHIGNGTHGRLQHWFKECKCKNPEENN